MKAKAKRLKATKDLMMGRLSALWLTCLLWPLVRACNVGICSQEYGSILTIPQQQWSPESSTDSTQQYCSVLNAYQQCLRSINKSCRGNLEFHTLVTLLKNWKNEKNCSQTSNQAFNIKTIIPQKHLKNIPSTVSQTNSQWRPYEDTASTIELQEKLQTCLAAAYNYTINGSDNTDNQAIDERTRLVNSEQNQKPRRTKIRGRRTRRDISPKFVPINGEAVDFGEEADRNDLDSELNPSVPSLGHNKPLMPPSSPLTCIIYGDPHLRTLDNEYQTCRCAGAWPLIEHPLFAVQITNSRIKGSNPQIFGVTKVTVLIRQFTKCSLHNDLIYEADSQSTPGQSTSPAATFIDGSTYNANKLIRITQSSNNNVITVHLDHIGVRVYIGQFESSYLNVVIKFRSATSTVKQQLVLKSIGDNSLCKSGCPKREQIDIQNVLKATGVDISANIKDSAQHSDDSDVDSDSDSDLKSDSSVVDNDDQIEADEDQSESGDSIDPCYELSGYYRISCLYDKTIKGVKHVNNANRFAQSFDEKKFIDNSIRVNSGANGEPNDKTNSSSTLTSNHCLNCMLFVISLIICFL